MDEHNSRDRRALTLPSQVTISLRHNANGPRTEVLKPFVKRHGATQ